MPDLESFKSAAEDLRGVLNPTSLQYSRTFSNFSGHEVWVKPENLQKTGSFKIRGAYTKMARMGEEDRACGVITASSGNHGAAVAYAAAQLQVPCTVVMPEDAPASKMNAVAAYGGEISQHGRFSNERKERAREIAEERGLTYVDSTEDEDIIAGQGTCSVEIIDEMPDVDVIMAPIGGGGLMSGVSTAAKLMRPDVQVIGVEPRGSRCMHASLEAGEPVTVDIDTIADGLRTPKPGPITFDYCNRFVDRIHLVSEEEITDATILGAERLKLLIEPSGAVSLAGLLSGAVEGVGKKVAVILTGGNVDIAALGEIFVTGLKKLPGNAMHP
ncbi:MAG: threonine/serine dehydratase [Clostridia bacterium]